MFLSRIGIKIERLCDLYVQYYFSKMQETSHNNKNNKISCHRRRITLWWHYFFFSTTFNQKTNNSHLLVKIILFSRLYPLRNIMNDTSSSGNKDRHCSTMNDQDCGNCNDSGTHNNINNDVVDEDNYYSNCNGCSNNVLAEYIVNHRKDEEETYYDDMEYFFPCCMKIFPQSHLFHHQCFLDKWSLDTTTSKDFLTITAYGVVPGFNSFAESRNYIKISRSWHHGSHVRPPRVPVPYIDDNSPIKSPYFSNSRDRRHRIITLCYSGNHSGIYSSNQILPHPLRVPISQNPCRLWNDSNELDRNETEFKNDMLPGEEGPMCEMYHRIESERDVSSVATSVEELSFDSSLPSLLPRTKSDSSMSSSSSSDGNDSIPELLPR